MNAYLPGPVVISHSQFSSSNAGKRVGIRLAAAARTRRRVEEAQAEEREQVIVNAAVESAGVEQTAQATEADEVYCSKCGTRRKLIFTNWKRGRAVCSCMRIGVKRRRLTFKQPDLLGVFSPGSAPALSNTVSPMDALGHILLVVDELTWCHRCGAYNTERIHGLNSPCQGVPGEGQAYRLQRLRRGRHPISNLAFSGAVKRLRVL